MKGIKSTVRQGREVLHALRASHVLHQAGWLATAKIVQGVASVVASLAIARHLGPMAFGELSLAIALANFVAIIASLGLEHIATRELTLDGERADRPILPTLRRLRIVGALIGTMIILSMSVLPYAANYRISGLLLVLCLLPLTQVGDLAEWQLVASGHSRRIAQIAILLSPLMAMTRICLVFLGANITAFAWALIAEWAMRTTLLLFSTKGSLFWSQARATAWVGEARSLLKDSMPLLMAGIAVFIYMRIDQFMIAGMLDNRQVGLYSAIVSLAEVPLILPTLLLRAALPTLTRQSSQDAASRDRMLEGLMRHAFYLHLAVAALLSALASPIIVTVYGAAFADAAKAFRVQVLAAPFVALGVLSSAWLVLNKSTVHALRRTLAGAVANILLNLLLIPRLGILGAALATLAAQLLSTYLADLGYPATRELFKMKTRAMLPGLRGFQ